MLLALDISTSCIGYAVFNENGSLIELDYVKFNSKTSPSYFQRIEVMKKKMSHLLSFEITEIAIEEPLKKFKGKYSSADTIAKLNFFNGMVSVTLATHFKLEPAYYNVNNARKTALPDLKIKKGGASSKHQVWEKVVDLEPQINWKYGVRSRKLVEENYDMCDAYIVGRCHIDVIDRQKKKLIENAK